MIELKLIKNFPREIIALDEVGRSPLSGPVVIGGVRLVVNELAPLATLIRSFRRCRVRDSKALSHQGRSEVLSKLGVNELPYRQRGSFAWKGLTLSYVTWNMDHDVIDRENIFGACIRGMKEAAVFLSEGNRDRTTVLIDGPSRLRWREGECPWAEHAIVKGDVKSSLIGLASIIAKEKRDAHMRLMHEQWPQYGFERNVGYPTREHREAIRIHGPSPIHRRSFCKVKEFIRD